MTLAARRVVSSRVGVSELASEPSALSELASEPWALSELASEPWALNAGRRPAGVSRPPYASFNLGGSVGDDPQAVASNRRRLEAELGVRGWVYLEQVHGARVAIATGPGTLPATDAAVTTRTGLGLVVLVADCVPVLFADAVAGVVGVAHAGRAGARAGIAAATLRAMIGIGADPASTDVLLGPAICGRCYEVPAAMRDDVEADLPGSAATTAAGTPGLDLRAGIAHSLADLGVARVVVDPRCTAEDRELFSYRRDGITGRQAGIAWLQ